MPNHKLSAQSFGLATGTFAYTATVGWIMFHGAQFFGRMQNFWGPVAFLLLFVLSATIVGLLVLGRPAYLYFNGQKREAIQLLMLTVVWLAIMTVAVFLAQPWRG